MGALLEGEYLMGCFAILWVASPSSRGNILWVTSSWRSRGISSRGHLLLGIFSGPILRVISYGPILRVISYGPIRRVISYGPILRVISYG
jgi:hypothetical protein